MVIRAWMPWLVLTVFVFAWGVPQVKNLLNGDDPKAIRSTYTPGTVPRKIDFKIPSPARAGRESAAGGGQADTEKAVYS